MHFPFTVTVPKSTPKATPYEKILPLTMGIITSVQVIVPPGPLDLTGLVILFHEFQLYPLSRGEYYHGDAVVYPFDDEQEILVSPYQLKARAWNLDTEYDHDFIVAFSMKRPEDVATSTRSLEALQALVGQVIS